jgi:hypothetical protein
MIDRRRIIANGRRRYTDPEDLAALTWLERAWLWVVILALALLFSACVIAAGVAAHDSWWLR